MSCDWYHGTWQFLRLLNMVAVPPWYGFYNDALTSALRKKPNANVLISACADCGMLATLHKAVETANANPNIVIYDICKTPLRACKWYANRNGFDVQCVCDNIITSKEMPTGSFDLIVTDEFLTVLKKEYKPMITKRWLELLTPGGTVVTTAMIGEPTTDDQRWGYADRARALTTTDGIALQETSVDVDLLLGRFEQFANFHTRHMLTGEAEIRDLFSDFNLSFIESIPTPGECVNPTHSFQIVASKPV
jgi:2-polyprenyl-3-methyl-5-hydroxy-6-metoxy-1,4-benzoquinol methylase